MALSKFYYLFFTEASSPIIASIGFVFSLLDFAVAITILPHQNHLSYRITHSPASLLV